MNLRFLNRIAELKADAWDALFPAAYPFTRHRFLNALETSGCVAPATGWIPHHAIVEDAAGNLLAAAPTYLKTHSYGEFVFDFSWAQASHRLGRAYYPKWLVAIPFTPATGPRIGAVSAEARQHLLAGLLRAQERESHSSTHALFLQDEDLQIARKLGAITRQDVQFHWQNDGYRDFQDFVGRMSSDKRKKLLRERRRVSEAGLRFEWRAGNELSAAQWNTVYTLYANTYEERGQSPYLNPEFFGDFGMAAATPLRLALAYSGSEIVAVAITIEGSGSGGESILYGRHWGAAAHYHSLHFETCYYQGIDYCIQHGIARYDAGAQGGHKLARGFLPVLTHSAHWVQEPRLREAVRQAMALENMQIDSWQEDLAHHAPYKMRTDIAQNSETVTLRE